MNQHSPTHPSSFASPKSNKSNKQESPFFVFGQTHRNSRGSFAKEQSVLYRISSKQDLGSPPKEFKSPKAKERLNVDMVEVMMTNTFQNSN